VDEIRGEPHDVRVDRIISNRRVIDPHYHREKGDVS
jgi:5-formyltetrahydrofolate cyclo-ligase